MIKRKFLAGAVALTAAILMCFGILTACEEATDYTVTFALDGGSMEADNKVTVAEGTVINLTDYIPQKTGYTFAGWVAGETTYAEDETLTVNANITLTAQWNINQYTVTFKDGETVLKTETVEYGSSASAPDDLTKTGYDFAGWDVAFDSVASDLTVNAKWEISKYVVTFHVDGGTIDAAEITVEHGSELNFSEHVPQKTGYIFNGWKSGDTTYTSADSVTVTSALEFTAQWTFAYKTEELSDGTLTIAGFAGDSLETVELPAEYNGKRITQIKANSFYYDDTIKSIVLDGMSYLESIGNGAFRSCANLETVSLNGLANLKSLGDSVFSGGFSTAGKMTSIDFTGCTGLESIGQMFFQYQKSLTSVDLTPCTSLTWIDRQMFDGCSALQTVSFPRSLQTINGDWGGMVNSDFFRSCDSLLSITVQPGSLYFESYEGVLYLRGQTAIVKYPAAKDAAEFIAPATVTTIYGSAFQNAANLTKIDLNACNGLTEIMFSAFQGCSAAELNVPFDLNGYYLNGTRCTLGSNWNRSVRNVVYGERYYFFEETFSGITDGMTTAQETLSFEAKVMYGEYTCALTVLNSTTETAGAAGENGSYSVTLQAGENVISVSAYCAEKDAEKSYAFTITYTTVEPEIVTDIEVGDDSVVRTTEAEFTFSLQIQRGDIAQEIESIKFRTKVMGSMSDLAENSWMGTKNYSVTYNEDKTSAQITIYFQNMVDGWTIDEGTVVPMVIICTFNGGQQIEVTYQMQYNG